MAVIYKVTNKVNNKVYIGFTENFSRRKKSHENKGKTGNGNYFHKALYKHGIDNFIWEILYESDNIQETLNLKESEFIEKHKSNQREFGYNLTNGGDGWSGCNHTEETKRKLSEIAKKRPLTEERLEILRRNAAKMKENGHTPETILRMKSSQQKRFEDPIEREKISSIVKKTWKNPNRRNMFTEEYKKKMSDSCKGKVQPEEMKNKLRQKATGRKRLYKEDGSWTWIYPQGF